MIIQDKRYGNTDPIELEATKYADNDNICIRGTCTKTGEPWCTYTVNMDVQLPVPLVALKTWSEGRGVDQVLAAAGVIEPELVRMLNNGFVLSPVFRLTPQAIQELGIQTEGGL